MIGETIELEGNNRSIFIIKTEVSHFIYETINQKLIISMKNGKEITVVNYKKEAYLTFKNLFEN